MGLRRRKPPFRRLGAQRVEVNLSEAERALLQDLPGQLRELLATDDPSLRRLFPVAYLGDDERNDEYQRLMREELLASRVAAAEVLEKGAHAKEISTDELGLWMNTANSVRLVLGTQLDVSEDEIDVDFDDPRMPAFEVYGWLGYLVDSAVRALNGDDGHDDLYDTPDLDD
jgi:Domain of unknown function (DUF2017)